MATVPTFITFVAGSILTASQMNSQVRDAGNYWLTVKPALEIRQTVAQSMTNGAWTSVTFDTEDYDNDGMHSTVTNPSRATCVTAGRFLFLGSTGFVANATGLRGAKWLKNGTTSYGKVGQYAAASGTDEWFGTSIMLYLAVGDYLEIQGWQNSGGAINTAVVSDGSPRMQAMWLANA